MNINNDEIIKTINSIPVCKEVKKAIFTLVEQITGQKLKEESKLLFFEEIRAREGTFALASDPTKPLMVTLSDEKLTATRFTTLYLSGSGPKLAQVDWHGSTFIDLKMSPNIVLRDHLNQIHFS